jgi:hypothetical protein
VLASYKRARLAEAKSEALFTIEEFEKLGVARDLDRCRELL